MISNNRNKKLKIGVDIDGVLGDQVTPILKKINNKYNKNLSKKDIVEWDYKIDDTNIEIEIHKALRHSEYILNMPVISDAENCMDYLFSNFYIVIASSRPKEAENNTKKWLEPKFKFHKYVNTHETGKSSLKVDILIDDNISNIKEFTESNRVGILFSQPWNQYHNAIKDKIKKQKIFFCEGWTEIIYILKRMDF